MDACKLLIITKAVLLTSPSADSAFFIANYTCSMSSPNKSSHFSSQLLTDLFLFLLSFSLSKLQLSLLLFRHFCEQCRYRSRVSCVSNVITVICKYCVNTEKIIKTNFFDFLPVIEENARLKKILYNTIAIPSFNSDSPSMIVDNCLLVPEVHRVKHSNYSNILMQWFMRIISKQKEIIANKDYINSYDHN